jgi:hypothetical protein
VATYIPPLQGYCVKKTKNVKNGKILLGGRFKKLRQSTNIFSQSARRPGKIAREGLDLRGGRLIFA